jgi:hypothetical protein
MNATMVDNGRAAALFCSDISIDDLPTSDEVAAAIREQVRCHRGVRGCAADVAQAYGDHPEVAARRMTWAQYFIAEYYPHGGTR